MSLRGVWIYKPSGAVDAERILFSRRFPAAECQAKRRPGYASLGGEAEFCTAVLVACGLSEKDEEFTAERDSCLKEDTRPVYEVGDSKHWPLVAITRHSLLFCALPVLDNSLSQDRPSTIELPGVTAAMDVLEQMAAHLGPTATTLTPADSQINDLYNILSMAMPFGTPLRTELSQVATLYATKPPPPSGKCKQPAWKPFPYKGSNKLAISLQERIKAAQYDRSDIADVVEVTGDIRCKAELESSPEVTMSISTPANSHSVSYLLTHPSVQRSEAHPPTQHLSPRSTSPPPGTALPATPSTNGPHSRELTFHPPPDSFVLCRYKSDCDLLPIRGFYQMKGDHTVKLLVQLKLVEGVRNQFDRCVLRLPFFNRGPISNVEFLPNSAQVSVSPDHRTLIWNIGQKFPSRTLETSLNATVTFQDEIAPTSNTATADSGKADEFVEDPFCVGLNAYAELDFRILDYTLSGCHLDPKSVSLYPNSRYKLNSSRELVSSGYRIWNSHGDARIAQPPSSIKP